MNIKTFKEIIEPKIGDYVICEEFLNNLDSHKFSTKDIMYKLSIFLMNNIGKINSIDMDYQVIYNNIPKDIKDIFFTKNGMRTMLKSEIIHWSPNINDLEHIIQANKYNL